MANRRMFSLDVVTTDKFRELTKKAQALYFQLGVLADDDGFLRGAKGTAKGFGYGLKALAELEENGYLIAFPDNVWVMKHWYQNNFIRRDRYIETRYKEEKAQLYEENGIYHFIGDGNHLVYQTETQSRTNKNKLNQININKERVEETPAPEETKNQSLLLGTFGNVEMSEEELFKLKQEFSDYEKLINNFSEKLVTRGYRYQNHYDAIITWAREDKNREAMRQSYLERQREKTLEAEKEKQEKYDAFTERIMQNMMK